jgi:hypothetical protein
VATYSFPGGQITGQALIVPGDPAPYAVAITGGSGKYKASKVRYGSAPPQKRNRGGFDLPPAGLIDPSTANDRTLPA